MEQLFACSQFSIAHSQTPRPIPVHAYGEYVTGYYFRDSLQVLIRPRLLNPVEQHEQLASAQARDYLAVALKKKFLDALLADLGSEGFRFRDFPTSKLRADASLQRLCESLLAEMESQELGRELVLTSLVSGFAIHLLRHLSASANHPESPEPIQTHWQIRKALDFLQYSYTQKLNLNHIAKAVGLSKYHLERVFKRATGMPLYRYMTMLRVESAKKQLESSQKPIVEIALELGFSDQSHLTNVFKRFTGVTPYAYRRRAEQRFQPFPSMKPFRGKLSAFSPHFSHSVNCGDG